MPQADPTVKDRLEQLETLGNDKVRAHNTKFGAEGCTSPFAPIWIDERVRRKG